MNWVITRLTWANLTNRPLSTLLTVATLLIAVSLISMLLQFTAFVEERLAKDTAGIDLVVGAKGSPLQLVLSSVYHVDVPTGNIPLKDAQALMRDPQIGSFTPLALGDSFRGFRIVGTTPDFIKRYKAELAEGSVWAAPQEVVIGARLNRELGMEIGLKFASTHGLASADSIAAEHDHALLEVVGVLEPTGSVIDRLILTSVDSVWLAHEIGHETGHDDEDNHESAHHDEEHDEHAHENEEHGDEEHGDEEHGDHDHHGEDHEGENHSHDSEDHEPGHESENHEDDHEENRHDDEHGDHDHHDAGLSDLSTMTPDGREVTALLIEFKTPLAAVRLPRVINGRQGLQAAAPAIEITRLFSLSEGLVSGARVLGFLFIIIGGLSIFVTVSNATAHKTYDIALLRSMGARPLTVFLQQLAEGALIAIFSSIGGIAFAHFLLFSASLILEPLQAVGMNGRLFPASEIYLFIGTVFVGIVAVIWPAARSYKLDPVILLKRGR